MTARKLLRMSVMGAAAIAVAAALLAGGAWFAFVPSANEAPYVFVTAWGERGSAPGQFDDPTGIAVAGEEVFVADSRNARIQVFDPQGGFLRAFSIVADGAYLTGRPMNLDIRGRELFVSDYWNDRIAVFGLDGSFHRAFGERGEKGGMFDAPSGVAVGPDGNVFVADFYNQRVQELSADGTFVRQWGETGKTGAGAAMFNYPSDVAVAPDGSLIAADGYNDRIQVFTADGRHSRKWGGPFAMNIHGPFRGWFATVTSVAVDAEGNVFVADFYNNRVQKFSPAGGFLTAFGTSGDGPGRMHRPFGIAVGDDGTVFVTDFGSNRVQVWRPEG